MEPAGGEGRAAGGAGASAFAAAGVSREGAFSIGEVLGKTFRTWGANVVPFGGVSLLFQLPVVAGNFLLGAPSIGAPDPDQWLRQGLGILSGFLSIVASGALTFGVLAALRGNPAGFGQLVGFGLRNFWRIFVVSVMVGVLLFLSTLCLVVPGIFVGLMLAVAVPAAVAEPRLSYSDALSRSRALTKDHRLGLFVALLVVWAAVMIPVMPLSTAALFVPALQGGLVYGTISAGSAVLGSLLSTVQAVAYHDLRVAKEGVATETLAAVFD